MKEFEIQEHLGVISIESAAFGALYLGAGINYTLIHRFWHGEEYFLNGIKQQTGISHTF